MTDNVIQFPGTKPKRPVPTSKRTGHSIIAKAKTDADGEVEFDENVSECDMWLYSRYVQIHRCCYYIRRADTIKDSDLDEVMDFIWETFHAMKAKPAETVHGVIYKICALAEVLGDASVASDSEFPVLLTELLVVTGRMPSAAALLSDGGAS